MNKKYTNLRVVSGVGKTSKKEYEALEVKIGEYSARLFPTKIEILYIKNILKKQAQEEFQQGQEGDGDLDVSANK